MINRNVTSFINERTLEYILVPELQRSLTPHCRAVMPMFFWKNREGGIRSRSSFPGENFKIVAMFARRPKIDEKSDKIYATINYQLIDFSHKAIAMGIPTIGGFCAAKNLRDMNSARPTWIPLWNQNDAIDPLLWQQSDSPGGSLITPDSNIVSVSQEELPYRVLPASVPMPFIVAIEAMDILRSTLNQGASFPYYYASAYKPVYFLAEDSQL